MSKSKFNFSKKIKRAHLRASLGKPTAFRRGSMSNPTEVGSAPEGKTTKKYFNYFFSSYFFQKAQFGLQVSHASEIGYTRNMNLNQLSKQFNFGEAHPKTSFMTYKCALS